VNNGLSLGPLYHKALDIGAIGVSEDHRVVVSGQLHGGRSVEEYLGRFHGKDLEGPHHGADPVGQDYLVWHKASVFKSPARAA